MQGDRWRKIDEIFHSALKVDESRRTAFLDETCSGDHDLRLELERLLARYAEAGTFLESPALEMAAQAVAVDDSSDSKSDDLLVPALVGEIISHYKILSKLGSGGMGVVYQAEDMRLMRRVALKFLRGGRSPDATSLQRFEAEARAASRLNHPNICTIYEVEEHNGYPVIVMELLEGQSLKDRIRAGSVSIQELLAFGIQASNALEAAHAKGIVHRDVKPANIFIVGNDRIKLLDFGVAKVIHAEAELQSAEESLTVRGGILGTISYMSPEQVSGDELDQRSDLFSLGVVLYELATGGQPFSRRNAVLTIGAILNDRPAPPSSLNPALPAALDTIIGRMLEKSRGLRYQHAANICSDLKMLAGGFKVPERSSLPVSKHWRSVAAACLAAVAAVAGTAFFYFHRSTALTGKDTIVLADFLNTTGDSVFDGALRQGLSVQLQQSPFLNIVSDERIHQTLRLMDRPPDARLTPELAREICERTGSAAVLEGSIANLGAQYVLGLRAKDCRTGDILSDEQGQAPKKEDVLNTLGQVAGRFRTRIGESLATIKMHATPLEEASTPSLEALKAYSAAWKISFSAGPAAAVSLLQRAIAIDPKFAVAHASLASTYASIWEPVLAAESAAKAYQLRDRASDRERFFIVLSYDLLVTGDLQKAQQTGELWAQTYPRDPNPHGFLSWIVQGLGKYEAGREQAKQAIDLDQDFVFGYTNLGWTYVFLNRFGEAESTLQQAAERKLEMPEFLIMRYYIAFLKSDEAGMARAAALGQADPGADDWISHEQASVLAYSGHLKRARSLSRRAIDLAQQTAQPERAAIYQAGAAVREAFLGNTVAARQGAAAALQLSKARDVEYGAAFALALSGEFSKSETLADDLIARFPEDTFVRFTYLPTLRALFALNRSEPTTALDMLQIAAPHDLAIPGSWSGFFGNLYPSYVRGTAFLFTHQAAEAAAEFQKILDQRAIVFSDPVAAAARLQLARALAMAGESAGAKKAYRDFLTVWKDADSDIPILKQARLEYAKLL